VSQSEKSKFSTSAILARFVADYNIGHPVGVSLYFSEQDKTEIRALLLASEAINAEETTSKQWDGLSRTESLAFGSNEKLTAAAVRSERIAVKSLPGRPLLMDGKEIHLPVGANIDMNWQHLSKNCGHSTILIVENWEAFDNVHDTTFDLSAAGDNPLVVFRGSPVYRQDYVVFLLKALQIPVFAFVDFDPAGLVIAQSLPHFVGLISPPVEELQRALKACKNYDRYRNQLPQAQACLDAATHDQIMVHWQLLQKHGKALPQEYFMLVRV
jgi:hypothetical protein